MTSEQHLSFLNIDNAMISPNRNKTTLINSALHGILRSRPVRINKCYENAEKTLHVASFLRFREGASS